mmetsp:Transcript_32902/g.101109  ORF Transcript_32902/g.101109 Transcript_32902/m.101109 type:complete len:221 (+) Transcript_32902:3-665(+)
MVSRSLCQVVSVRPGASAKPPLRTERPKRPLLAWAFKRAVRDPVAHGAAVDGHALGQLRPAKSGGAEQDARLPQLHCESAKLAWIPTRSESPRPRQKETYQVLPLVRRPRSSSAEATQAVRIFDVQAWWSEGCAAHNAAHGAAHEDLTGDWLSVCTSSSQFDVASWVREQIPVDDTWCEPAAQEPPVAPAASSRRRLGSEPPPRAHKFAWGRVRHLLPAF